MDTPDPVPLETPPGQPGSVRQIFERQALYRPALHRSRHKSDRRSSGGPSLVRRRYHQPELDQFCANIPTDKIFTLPHWERVDGTLYASLPLSYAGSLIENFSFTLKDGKVVDFSGEKGKDTLRELLDTDEAARRLGEVALVPHSSPVSQTGVLFYNTLFDENAASHPALGRANQFTL